MCIGLPNIPEISATGADLAVALAALEAKPAVADLVAAGYSLTWVVST